MKDPVNASYLLLTYHGRVAKYKQILKNKESRNQTISAYTSIIRNQTKVNIDNY